MLLLFTWSIPELRPLRLPLDEQQKLCKRKIHRPGSDSDRSAPSSATFFISVLNQLDEQNLFYIKFYFMHLHVSSTCAHHQAVKIALHSLWYHHTYRCDDTRDCVMQF